LSAGEERGQDKAPEGWVVGKLVERERGGLGGVEEMPTRVGHGMGMVVAGDIAVGRERASRGVARTSEHGWFWRCDAGSGRKTSIN